MVLMDNDGFLTALTRFFQQTKSSGSVYLTMKKYNGRTKPKPKGKGKKRAGSPDIEEQNLCLLRATTSKKTISTVVSAKEVTRFQMLYGSLLRAHIDGLKKREKKGTTASSKSTSSATRSGDRKQKKGKATV